MGFAAWAPSLVCLLVLSEGDSLPAAAAPAASLTVRADWFDRGNVRVSLPGEAYADQFACIWNGGAWPNQAEYDIPFPVTARYTFQALYTAAASRPVEIYLDDRLVHTGFASVTGSWQTGNACWERQCTLDISQGRHTIRLRCPGPCLPHICAFRLESPVAFPDGWTLERVPARQAAEREAGPTGQGHLIPEVPLLAHLDAGLRVEVVAVGQYAGRGVAATDELMRSQQAQEAAALTTPYVARLTRPGPDGSLEQQALPLSPARLREMLRRTVALIDDFRSQPAVEPHFLEPERDACHRRTAQLEALLRQADSPQRWQRLGRLYLDVFRLQRRVALANPLLAFDRLLLIQRNANSPQLGLPQNWQGNCALPNSGFDDEIAVLAPPHPGGELATLFRPARPGFVGDVDLHFDGDRLLYSATGEDGLWQVYEVGIDGSGWRQVTPSLGDVHHYDACYLPDGGLLFASTASMAAVPCVNGSSRVANLYRLEPDGAIRQLCFDQEHNWCPTPLEDGRVLYLRWEYTDTPHSHDRVLFTMNPDGTSQREFYGSNSYWPNALFYARPVPARPGMFVGIVGGHHGVPRMGELVLFDVRRGRREATGAVQRIPGHGQPVAPATDPRYESTLIQDELVDASWPKFLHPYPLSDKYFLVACRPTPRSLWGIYLVDVFDNLVLLHETPGAALLEPLPLRPHRRPPCIPPAVDLQRRDAVVHLADIYAGDGLKGIPRGTVKRLRLISYHFLFPGMGGPQGVVGMEGPWDIKRIVGTVPVEPDGSASFRIPANTPIAVQPLDAEGKALQLMRSWFTGMPGEVLSCTGCHESQNLAPPVSFTRASRAAPREIDPWYGPPRGFSFQRELQPVLDRFCVACHNGQSDAAGETPFDLRGRDQITDYTSAYHFGGDDAGHFSTSYVALHRFVRRPGLESDYHQLMPMEYHADTTQLVQLLAKGHHGVTLDAEAWDRIVTWIDLNAPYHGTWTEIAGAARVAALAQRRRALRQQYANVDEDPESEAQVAPLARPEPFCPDPLPPAPSQRVACPGWPFDAAEASRRQQAEGPCRWTVELGEDVALELVRIPAGRFVMGSNEGHPDERPPACLQIHQSFWMGRAEITNRQFRLFDPQHDSRVESRFGMQFGVRGFYVNDPARPVVRVCWQRAMAFCDWLSRQTGQRFTLPTEAQWEYACRAGSDSPFYYGDQDTDFAPFANLADRTLSEFVCHPYKKQREPLPNRSKYDDWIPKDTRFDDGGFLSEEGGRYQANAWGLLDMHGNVAEWTRSAWLPYPYSDGDPRHNDGEAARVVRGGSWRDRPLRARSAFRLAYPPYQPVYNVGFRVVCESEPDAAALSQASPSN